MDWLFKVFKSTVIKYIEIIYKLREIIDFTTLHKINYSLIIFIVERHKDSGDALSILLQLIM